MTGKDRYKSALNVMKGVEQPSQINEAAAGKIRSHRPRILPAREYLDGILAGNRTILSKAITLVESNLPAHRERAEEVIAGCLKHEKITDSGYRLPAGQAGISDNHHPSSDIRHPSSDIHHPSSSIRIGITGVPGVGKSTFIEALGTSLTEKGHKLAVLAIDPSSSRSKGSILGDKTRMETLATDPNAFIRPSPSAGSLGGVARKTRETIILCEAAGFDVIFIETVGVGQSETTVHSMVDFFLLLMLAGAGDELQGIKRGIIEMADAIVINKADGDNINKAMTARVEYANALALFPPPGTGWMPVAEICSARTRTGIDRVWELVTEHRRITGETGAFRRRRMEQDLQVFRDTIEAGLQQHFYGRKEAATTIHRLEQEIMNGTANPYQAANDLLNNYFG
jgi:LAO/AO transport system kinase